MSCSNGRYHTLNEKKPKPSKWFYFILKLNGICEQHDHFSKFRTALIKSNFRYGFSATQTIKLNDLILHFSIYEEKTYFAQWVYK